MLIKNRRKKLLNAMKMFWEYLMYNIITSEKLEYCIESDAHRKLIIQCNI